MIHDNPSRRCSQLNLPIKGHGEAAVQEQEWCGAVLVRIWKYTPNSI